MSELSEALASARALARGLHNAGQMKDAEVVLRLWRAAQRIEARSDETPKEAQPVGQEPDGEADAPENKAVDPYALGGGK